MLSAIKNLSPLKRDKLLLQRLAGSFHLFNTRRKKHEIPKHLQKIPTDKNPNFSHMVQYYYHASAQFVEPFLIKEMAKKYPKMDEARRKARVSAILKLIGTVGTCIEVNFPIIKGDGTYEIITGYRAHHIKHRLPTKGGRQCYRLNPKMIIHNINIAYSLFKVYVMLWMWIRMKLRV